MRVCTFEGCQNPVHARNFCVNCYARWLRKGTPDYTGAASPKPCVFTGCLNKTTGHQTLCKSHLNQLRLGKPLTPLKHKMVFPAVDGMKKCNRCMVTRPVTAFYKAPKANDGLRGQCSACVVKQVMAYRA